jgi:peptidyl-prolyl cis-trans isomerase D
MLTWISQQAKWVIYIFIVFILAGLLFMDMSQLQTDKTPPIAKVNDEVILQTEFQQKLQQVMQAQAGANLTDAQTAQLRQELLNQFIQERLLNKVVANLDLSGSDAELWQDLVQDPIPGVQKAPIFQTDSTFDPAKYQAWLDTAIAGSISDPQLVQYREYLRNQKIPQKQLQILVTAGYHPSSLEATWSAAHRESRFQLWVAQASVDSFQAQTPDSAAIQAYFTANPDSFYVTRDLVKLSYVALPIQPSARDERSANEWASMLVNQLKEGADFAELAKMNSEDLVSSEKGGEVADINAWGPAFAQAATTLDSGKIVTEPLRTAFGWHVIQALGKTGTKDSVKVKVRHILVKVTASTETVDSLVLALKSVKEGVDAGKSISDVAKELKYSVQVTDWFGKGDEVPGMGFMQGLSSYAFVNTAKRKGDEISSAVLQNKAAVAVFVKSESISAGSRNIVPFKQNITTALMNKARIAEAGKYLQSKLAEVQSVAKIDSANRNAIAKVTLDAIDNGSFEGFVPGVGYASPTLYKALSSQKVGEWGSVLDGSRAAVLLKIISKTDPDPAALQAAVAQEVSSSWMYGGYSMFGDYMKNLQAGAQIVNNMDLYFAE